MSHSYRHTPIIGYCSHSDKPGKSKANRALRVAERKAFAACTDFDSLIMPILREVSNVWDFPKDGKGYMKNWKEESYRKYMRK